MKKDFNFNDELQEKRDHIERLDAAAEDFEKSRGAFVFKDEEKKEDIDDFLNRKKIRDQVKESYPLYFENEFGKDFYPRELYAGFFRRFFAFVFDGIIGSACAGIIVNLIFNLFGLKSQGLYTGLSTFFFLLYFTLTTYFTGGQSLGKMVFNLKVVSLDGNDLTLSQVVTREFFGRFIHTYSFLFMLYVLVAFTERKQSLSDIFADTTVLDLSKEKAYMVGQIDRESYIYE